MNFEDIYTILVLIIGLAMAAALVYILMRRGVVRTRDWPLVLGIGGGASLFIGLVASKVMIGGFESIFDNIASNCLLAIFLGVMAYISGRKIHRSGRDR